MLPPPMPNRTCEGCGDPLAPEFCDPVCGNRYRIAHADPAVVEHWREMQRQRAREWAARNPEHVRTWKQANPELVRRAGRRRRALKNGVPSEPYTLIDLLERDGYCCHLCREKIDPTLSHPDPMCATVDHVVPLSRGGTDLRSNVAPAHLRCNLVKKDRPASELRLVG
jgi:5-methylcytosine-specific restriction endonuclease McrA